MFKSQGNSIRLWLAGRGGQVVVAELIPVIWPKTSHLIVSNQIFNRDHDRMSYFSVVVYSLMMCANNRVHYGLVIVYGYLHITLPNCNHYADLSEGIELLKCLSDIFCLECVSKIRVVLSIIFHAIYGAVCIQLTHFSYDDCENICTSHYHQPFGSMTHLPLFRVRSWNIGMRWMCFYILVRQSFENRTIFSIERQK